MQRFGKQAARAFKLLAGQDRDEPLRAHVFALYSFLFTAGMVIVVAWATAPA